MADYENLLDSIDAVIRSNNRREITGQILQNTLHQMVASLGENYQLAGFATPTLDPNSPDQNVFYITDEAGVYTNFDNITLGNGLSFLMWKNEEWTSKTLDIVTADWVDEHYVSKAFLRKVFQFFDEDGVEIFPNDTESVVDNIKAMCGLWTNEYLSALGLGEGSTIPTTLAALNDVTITNPQDGQALVYDAASLHWVNATIQSGVDMSVVWAALAAATNEQINISHLTTALNDYVTATSLATTLQSYVTTSALATELASYASQSWVETNYVSKAFFNSLFEAQDVNGNAITPNNSGQTTIDRLKILVGAYTEQYLSALGLSSGGGGGGSSTLAGLNDVTITNPQDGQALIYDAQSSHWVNGAAISMSAVWTALAAATSEQINSSHLTSALSGYVTTSALASELANYVTTSSLATTLADYVTTSALATTLADYGSKTWIDNNYVSKAFFNRLFQAFAPLAEGQTEPTQVEPNDTTTTIDNIKAMFGLWTEQYLSALGLSAGGGHTIGVLDDLNDVTISNPQTNQVLKYNGTQWVNDTAPSGASALSGLTDVAISSLADKDLLQWDYATGKWKNVVLSTAMSAYALASAIPTNVSQLNNDSGYITSAALSGYATQQWVGQQGYALTSQIPTNNNQLTNGAGYITSSGSCASAGSIDYKPVVVSSDALDAAHWANQLNAYRFDSFNTSILNNNGIIIDGGWGSTGFGFQILIDDDPTYIMGLRQKGNGGWNAWKRIPMGDGTGASGTWGINITGSAADADKLDGYHATIGNNKPWGTIPAIHPSGWMDIGKQLEFHYDNTTGSDYSTLLVCTGNYSNIVSLPSSSGTLALTSQIPTTLPASDVYAWAKASTKPSYNFSEIGAGAAIIGEGANYISFRTNTTYESGIYYHTAGNEALVFANKYNVTSWIFANTSPSGRADWTSLSPALQIKSNCVYINSLIANGVAPSYNLYVNGSTYFNGTITIAHGERIQPNNGGDLYIGDASNRSWVLFQDICSQAAKGDTLWSIRVNGNAIFANVTSNGGVTALSDIRHKSIVDNTRLQVSDIAKMRAVRYIWDDGREDKGIHVGSIAQDWQQILPEVVLRANNDEGTLSLQYGVAALISSITIARKVVNHEQRITELERENADLKQAYSFIKNAYDYLKMDYENLKLMVNVA